MHRLHLKRPIHDTKNTVSKFDRKFKNYAIFGKITDLLTHYVFVDCRENKSIQLSKHFKYLIQTLPCKVKFYIFVSALELPLLFI